MSHLASVPSLYAYNKNTCDISEAGEILTDQSPHQEQSRQVIAELYFPSYTENTYLQDIIVTACL